ncbi:uncharacterized protein LOC118426858 [Branchiostoma floridae]|uniref:Uncharacterized protein LOC118426858 n=1 Tax=Branchiostoma floridae TaxID=7739 RepID=A0A9J7M2Z2_BRAFL|nr:uncharacterized protein LOC118426858 [Branchiostoma floridae]
MSSRLRYSVKGSIIIVLLSVLLCWLMLHRHVKSTLHETPYGPSTGGNNDGQYQPDGTSTQLCLKLIKEMMGRKQSPGPAYKFDKAATSSPNAEAEQPERQAFQGRPVGLFAVAGCVLVILVMLTSRKEDTLTHPVQPIDNDGPHHGPPPVSLA